MSPPVEVSRGRHKELSIAVRTLYLKRHCSLSRLRRVITTISKRNAIYMSMFDVSSNDLFLYVTMSVCTQVLHKKEVVPTEPRHTPLRCSRKLLVPCQANVTPRIRPATFAAAVPLDTPPGGNAFATVTADCCRRSIFSLRLSRPPTASRMDPALDPALACYGRMGRDLG